MSAVGLGKQLLRDQPVRRFRVLDGVHTVAYDTGTKDRHGDPIMKDRYFRARRQNDPPEFISDVFEADCDMTQLNPPGFPPKFSCLDHESVSGTPLNPLEKQLGETGEAYAVRMQVLAENALRAATDAEKGLQAKAADKARELQARLNVQQAASQPSQHSAHNPTTKGISQADLTKLQGCNVKQLTDWAAGEEIDLGTAKTKEEILKKIQAAYG